MSAYASLGAARIISGHVTILRYGIWTADVLLDLTTEIAAQTTLTIGDLVLTAHVYRMATFAGSRSALALGGFGGWLRELPPRAYRSASGVLLSIVLGDAAREVGESIVVANDVSLGTQFTRERMQAGKLLRQLAGPDWWVANDGVTHVGPRPSGAISSPFTAISYSASKGRVEIATENLADWMPGRSFTAPTMPTARTIQSVIHTLTNEGTTRTEVLVT